MGKLLPLYPKHPERICWGCDALCPVESLACGNGSVRTPHPVELFGEGWAEWAVSRDDDEAEPLPEASARKCSDH